MKTDIQNIFKNLELPSEEELEKSQRETAIQKLPELIPFYIENWPKSIKSLSMQTKSFSLDQKNLEELLTFIKAMMSGGKEDHQKVKPYGIFLILNELINNLGGKIFIRTGSRSPKDNPCIMGIDLRPIPIYTSNQALEALGYSERVYLDLNDMRLVNYTPQIHVRRFINIDPEKEFRCFVEDKKIVGITQYYLEDVNIFWIKKNETTIEEILRDYIENLIIPQFPLPSFTCDIALNKDFQPLLIEINPPISTGTVFPGLFDSLEDLDNSFRYIGKRN